MNKRKRDIVETVVEITLFLAFLPALLGYYLNYNGRVFWSLLCYLISVAILITPIVFYAVYRCIMCFLPLIGSILIHLNRRLSPIVRFLSRTKVVGPLISLCIRIQFFVWFMVLLMSDHMVRIVLGRVAGQHVTKRYLSLINVVDPHFFQKDQQKSLEDREKKKFGRPADQSYGFSNPDFKRPQYSLSMAHALSVASKLVYEDVAVVKYELQQAGYDVEHTFKAMGYKNVCAYVVEKDNNVMLVFRGTNPLNIQNYVTNIDAGLTRIESVKGHYMGRVHKGFWDAMGTTVESPDKALESSTGSGSVIKIDVSHASLLKSVSAAIIGVVRVMKALTVNVFTTVIDPIDSSWAGHNALIVRHQSMYSQAEKFIQDIFSKQSDNLKEKRLFITGHSLGGALATVFLAKMIQNESPLLKNFSGLYTYGQPNIGDKDFSRSFNLDITCKIFNHTYNNDIIPRVPPWYSPPPGTLVFIDSTYKISIYPPNQTTQEPVPVRNISFLHLSGLLNKNVICRLRTETPLRILFRILLPFILNDHFPSDYSRALLSGNVEWVIIGETEGGHVNEEEEQQITAEEQLGIGKVQQKDHQPRADSLMSTSSSTARRYSMQQPENYALIDRTHSK